MEKKERETVQGIFHFYKVIFLYAWQKPFLVVSLIIQLSLQNICFLAGPFVIKDIFDKAIAHKNLHLFYLLLTFLVILMLISIITIIIITYLSSSLANHVINQLRSDLHTKILTLPTAVISKYTTGDIASRFSEDISAIRTLLRKIYWDAIFGVLYIIAGISLLFYLNALISVIVISLMLIFLPASLFIARLNKKYLAVKRQVDAASLAAVYESFVLHNPIRILRLSCFRKKQFDKELHDALPANSKYDFLGLMEANTISMGTMLGRFVALALGGYFVFIGLLTIGGFLGYFTLVQGVMSGIIGLAGFYPFITQALDSFNRISVLLTAKQQAEDFAECLPDLQYKIQLKNISLTYPGANKTALTNINLDIPKNAAVAIVGVSGSGKSTLLNLLTRGLYPDEGVILWDGHDVKNYSVCSLLTHIRAVLQTPYAFNATIFDNIRMGKLDASREEVIKAAKDAEVHAEIMNLPQGYDTVVGTEGQVQLSIGQRQRIILAQALLGKPELLILDEPTASLDPINRDAIQNTLLKQLHKYTIVLVTHHLREASHMDKIYVMKDGTIVESGKHQQLLELNGYYSQLWNKQSGATLTAGGLQMSVDLHWLQQIPIFKNFNLNALDRLARHFFIETVDMNQVVINEGEAGDKFYIIAHGKVDVSQDFAGKQKRIAVLEDGDFFGELSLLQSIPRTARITSRETTTFLVLYQAQFKSLLRQMSAADRKKIEAIADDRLKKIKLTSAYAKKTDIQ
ncbi:ATP-binding cassette domain-containing protein [Legionella septentrionalis]|uniref:ATP-binding cassette domain-containing protein n=1 Tax=Legionella septentrionalis TaxID=2498109 RepID=UPI000F8E8F40|nr:ATP-binding cassette domain-containing protein [Legionella septentrionalis]RUR09545.1 ATP-binding cassette domain-containing protein [Legionella septentrionalis]